MANGFAGLEGSQFARLYQWPYAILATESTMHEVDIKEAQSCLPDLIDEAMQGKEIVISKDAHAAVRLVPIVGNGGLPTFGSAKGQIDISDDFDAPLDDFQPYIK
jgi:antitoxin (DNA-binding transcriptional repressor) of toxin-antitoxin stability system